MHLIVEAKNDPIHLVGLYTTRLPVFQCNARGYDWILVDSIGQPSLNVSEWLPPVWWKVEPIEHDTDTNRTEEDFIWFAASDELPDVVADVPGGREYGSAALIRLLSWGTRRLQNSPYIFAYSSTREQPNKRSGTRLKTESETGGV